MKRFLCLSIGLFALTSAFSQPKHELRAVWIASVDNIDWPPKGMTDPAQQRAEFIRQLDMHQRNGMNAVIVQIRPAADAFYPSDIEPWSEWLTGRQGQAPNPYYDPLLFMITETHKRGMEFHAWCNPYRAVFRLNVSSISPTHITRVHPEWFLNYGDTKYFDPGNKEVQLYVTAVIRDICKRYDVDALHFDDYFYPYRIAGKEFPDQASFAKYGNGMSKEDWRRSNTDSIIVLLSRAIKEEKKFCKFGISPFGIWRNAAQDSAGSNTHAGQTNYDDLYADILLWLKNKWIDYVMPQDYFEFEHHNAPFENILDWWNDHSYGRDCYIGLGMYRAGSNAFWRDRTQLPRQMRAVRTKQQVQGMAFFSSKSFNNNPYGWNDSLRTEFYNYPALIPPMAWIDTTKPAAPFLSVVKGADSLVFYFQKGNASDSLRGYAIYRSLDNINADSTLPYQFIPYKEVVTLTLKAGEMTDGREVRYFVTSVSRTNNESAAIPVHVMTTEKH